MDIFTHVATGGVIAKAIDDKKLGNWGMVAGLAMGAFPDSDFVLGFFDRQFYLQYHRDFTHSLLLLPFYALFFGWVLMKISKRPHFWSFYKICFAALLSHVLLDLITSFGTMIFSPFFEYRFAWDLVFIIDPIFSGILILPWLVSFFLKRTGQWICRGSLIGLTAYLLFCWVQHGQALTEVRHFSKGLGEEVIQTAALPQPGSPFRWALYVETKDKVYQGFVDLRRKDFPAPFLQQDSFFRRLNSLYYPPGNIPFQSSEKFPESPWVQKALAAEGIRFYYWFARFPVVKSIHSMDGNHRVEFMDVRFYLPGIRLPFVYYVELDGEGRIQSEGFVEDSKKL